LGDRGIPLNGYKNLIFREGLTRGESRPTKPGVICQVTKNKSEIPSTFMEIRSICE